MSDLIPRQEGSVVLVGVDFGLPHFDGELEELGLLAQTAGLAPVAQLVCKRKAPDPALFVGSGKADELKALAELHQASEIVFDQALSPAQQRNLERQLGVAVYDRTFLILEIFAQRARSHEGKLQVELARLQYLSTRLVRRWSHLERQRGGIGARGGPGEAQIELDRRMIGEQVKKLKERIRKVGRVRDTQRSGRTRSGILRVALVGYTNAGKSTLFNCITGSGAFVADQLFATLDTTTRRVYLAADASITLSDTVGFIRDLPHTLVDSFKATLEETIQADLLLHVVDRANAQYQEQIEAVNEVLEEIGAAQVPQVLVFNQIDRIPGMEPEIVRDSHGKILNIKVSAFSGAGVDGLREALAEAARGASRSLPTAA